MFLSPNILHHYVEFNIHTITTLEKLLSARSFGGFISHLAHCHVTLPTSSSRLGLPFIVQTIAQFLGCWALIVLALITHF
jgi:hypothetical protein